MVRAIIGSSLRLRFMIVTAAAALVIVGFAKMGDTPTDLLPEFSPPVVQIQTEALGLSAAEVEQLITVPLEADLLNGVAWMDTIRSESIPSLSSIELTFLPGTDVMDARQMVQEKLTEARVAMTSVSKPSVMLQPLSSTSRAIMIGLSSKELSLIQMSVLARWNIKPRLMGLPGVANVAIWGQRQWQLQVQVDPKRLKDEGVSLLDIIKTTGNALWVSPLSFVEASAPGTGGFIDTPNQRLGVRHVLPIVSQEDLAKVVIENSDKRLGDVARLVETHQPLIGDAIVGNDTGLILVVEKFPWANTLDVTRSIEKGLEDLRPGLAGLEIDTKIFRPASFLERAISNLKAALVGGGLLIVLGLALFFLDWRVTLISAAAIVSSLLMTWFVLFLRGVTVDGLVFVGLMLAIGAIVDDAIIDVQNIRRRLSQERAKGKNAWDVIAEAAVEMRGVMGFATLMLLLLVLPVLFLQSVMGIFLSSIAMSYVLAVIFSVVVALTLTPALSLLLLPKEPGEVRPSPLSKALVSGWETIASKFFASTRQVYVIAGVALLALLVALPLVRSKPLLPEYNETDLLIKWNAKAGTSHPEMSRITAEAVRELRKLAGIRNVGAHVGRAVTSDQIVGINSSEIWVSIDPEADYDATLQAIEEVVDSYPGLENDVSTYPLERIRDLIEGEEGEDYDEITVRIYGQDSDVLAQEGQKMKDALANIDGVTEIEVSRPPIEPTIEIRADLARAKNYGIKPGDVRRAATTLLSGLEVGSLYEGNKIFDVVVWGTPETRASLSDVSNLLFQAPNGEYLRLADVADVRIAPHPAVLMREGVARYVDVTLDVYGRPVDEVAKEIDQLLAAYSLPMEYHAKMLDGHIQRASAQMVLFIALLTTAIGIFLLLQAAFRSWRLAGLVFLTLPVAPLGGIVVVLLTGAEFSLGSFVGVITVVGLAIRIGTLLITHYQRLERREGIPFGPDLVARGTRERAVPILATTLVTALAALPFLLFQDSAGLEIVGPMAGVVLAGLVTTLVLTLFLLPALYLAFGSGATVDEDFEDLTGGRSP